MIKIYVDGSSKGNPGPGGSGVVAYDSVKNEILLSHAQYYDHVTNNQAELQALLYALNLAQTKWKDEYCMIYSDSAYCVNMCNTWIHGWARNGWLNSKKQQVENYDLVRAIYKYISKPEPNFDIQKIPGHSGYIGNEIADALASNNEKKFNDIIEKESISYSVKDIIDNFKNK